MARAWLGAGARRGIAKAVLAAGLALALLEIGARVLLPARDFEAWRRASLRYAYHADYHWHVRPGVYLAEHGPIRVNALGLRGPEPALPKPDGLPHMPHAGGRIHPRAENTAAEQRLRLRRRDR